MNKRRLTLFILTVFTAVAVTGGHASALKFSVEGERRGYEGVETGSGSSFNADTSGVDVGASGQADVTIAGGRGRVGVTEEIGGAKVGTAGEIGGRAGGRGDIGGQMVVGAGGIDVGGGAEAFVGVEVDAKVEGSVDLKDSIGIAGGLKVGGEGKAGVGGSAKVNVNMAGGKVKADVEVGAAAGVGLGAGIELEADLSGTPEKARQALKNIRQAADDFQEYVDRSVEDLEEYLYGVEEAKKEKKSEEEGSDEGYFETVDAIDSPIWSGFGPGGGMPDTGALQGRGDDASKGDSGCGSC